MAHLMVVQGSGRRKGFTATLMKRVVERLEKIDDLEVEIFHLHDYRYGPCTSCFYCIRNVGSGCNLDDDWGKKGDGVLYKAFMRTNGLLMVDPVHGWGVSAAIPGSTTSQGQRSLRRAQHRIDQPAHSPAAQHAVGRGRPCQGGVVGWRLE